MGDTYKNRFSWRGAIALLVTSMLAACGGGGGDGGGSGGGGGGNTFTPITYSGNNAQATISESNAKTFFDLIFGSSASGGVSQLSTASVQAAPSSGATSSPLIKRLRDRLQYDKRRLSASKRAVGLEVNDTQNCAISGTVTFEGTLDDATGLGDLTATFKDCNDFGGVLNGQVVYRILAVNGPNITDLLIDIRLIQLVDGPTDISTSGSVSVIFNPSTNVENDTINTINQDNVTKRSWKFENVVQTWNLSLLSLELRGRVFDSVEGYVDVSVATPLFFVSPSASFPGSGGPVFLAGATQTRLIVTPQSSTTVKLGIEVSGAVTLAATIGWNSAAPPVFDPPAPIVTPPSITSQPQPVTVTVGDPAMFNVTATGTAPLSYQWRRNGIAIGGATSSTYTLASTQLSDNGVQFSVVVSNTGGSATSANALLTVNNVNPPVSHTVRFTWNPNREAAVNRAGGGYKVYYSTTPGFQISVASFVNVPYVSGSSAPTTAEITLDPGTYYFKVVAYSLLNPSGSAPSAEISLTIPPA